jgi:hypothetical protein
MIRSEKPVVRKERTEGEVGEGMVAVLVVEEEGMGGGDMVKAKVVKVVKEEGRDSTVGQDTTEEGDSEALVVDTGAEGVMVRLNPRARRNDH